MTQTTDEQSKYVLNEMKLLDPEGIFSKLGSAFNFST